MLEDEMVLIMNDKIVLEMNDEMVVLMKILMVVVVLQNDLMIHLIVRIFVN